jgi:hypothetical protein
MKYWWCMECQTNVGLNKQGRCENCDSEGVDQLFETEISRADSAAPKN